ncbi:unnamed protein product [Adineta steineri]|uniref:Ribosomal protein eL8/eL30/eS12/Gadd45 domain-containing protein n=1 Tax=Adineta steineri TaxID=433720 RepID=A0A815DSV3_9BILA|nr:unnamed protein product [Adineta steineri]
MTTSQPSDLSPEAKEFIPLIQIPPSTGIPLYIDDKSIATVYSSDQQQQQQQQTLFYPLMKFPEVEFHVQTPQQFHIDSNNQSHRSTNGNNSQIVLVPTNGCYPNPQIFYSTNNQSSTFYPIGCTEPLPPSSMNYSHQQPKMNSISSFHHQQQRGVNHSSSYRSDNQRNSYYDQQESSAFNNRRNFNSINSKRRTRGGNPRSIQQHDEQKQVNLNFQNNENNHHHIHEMPFKLRQEDFPSLPITNQQSEITPLQSINTQSTLSWNKVVSASRPQSTSPHSSHDPSQSDKNPSANKKNGPNTKKSSTQAKTKPLNNNNNNSKIIAQSLNNNNNNNVKTNELQTKKNDKPIQTKQQKKNLKQKKNEKIEEPTIEPVSISETIPFSLNDDNAFPVLGQDISIPIIKKSENNSSIKDNTSTPGLITKSKIKANHSYQICLQDMFNALNTSTQTKQQNSHNKSSNIPMNIANPLDSNPAPKRGKEREQPKPRKPTKLKRIINKELDENQKQRQQLLIKATTIKQNDENDNANVADTDDQLPINMTEDTSASCTEESNNGSDDNDDEDDDDDDDDDDDEIIDHEPTSQLQTPYAHQIPQSNIKQQIHDAGFREYCSQLIDRQLDELCIQLLLTLKRFQDRKKQQFQSNPERARRKRRFVHGIREVTKHLRLQRLKCVLIAPDCQSIQSQGGLNDAIEQIINLCKEQNIPYIFTLNRQKLGRCLNKISRISTIGIFDYSGADTIYRQIIEITNENQRAYKQIIDNLINHDDIAATTTPSHGLNSREFYKILHRTFQQQNQQQRHHIVNTIPTESLSKVLPKVPAHYAHSRQTSDTSTIYIDQQLINSIKKQHTRASSGTYDMGKNSTTATTNKKHQRTLSDGAATIDDTSITTTTKHHSKTHSRTPSGCSAISQIEQQDYFEQSKNILINNNNNNNNNDEIFTDNDETRLKSINEDTEENSANIKRKNVEKWINDN